MEHAKHEDLLHVAIVLLLLFLIAGCATKPVAPTPTPVIEYKAPEVSEVPPTVSVASTVSVVPECPVGPDYSELASVDRAMGQQAMYRAFREYITEQCTFNGCRLNIPTFEQLSLVILSEGTK